MLASKNPSPPVVTRFAPSPNGPMHLGHAWSAIFAHDIARAAGGTFLLRIEDIDGARSRPEMIDDFRRNLEWLGLEWDEVPAQSTRLGSYARAANDLAARGLLYRCTCTRKQIEDAGARKGEDGLIYPGTCKHAPLGSGPLESRLPDPAQPLNQPLNQPFNQPAALRLDTEKALREVGELIWTDAAVGPSTVDLSGFGDVVIMRKDAPASYHLAVTLDDAADGVTNVTRGADLFTATHVHRMLQALLGLPVPLWHHHALLVDKDGRKLAKRRGSPALSDRRKSGEDGRTLAAQLRLQKTKGGT